MSEERFLCPWLALTRGLSVRFVLVRIYAVVECSAIFLFGRKDGGFDLGRKHSAVFIL